MHSSAVVGNNKTGSSDFEHEFFEARLAAEIFGIGDFFLDDFSKRAVGCRAKDDDFGINLFF